MRSHQIEPLILCGQLMEEQRFGFLQKPLNLVTKGGLTHLEVGWMFAPAAWGTQ